MSENLATLKVPNEYCGQRVDLTLAKLLPHYSRAQLSQWLKAGLITINKSSYKPKDKVMGGELVEFCQVQEKTAHTLCAQHIPLEIVFEDEHLLVLNKPAGLVVHPGAGNASHTLVNGLLFHEPTLMHLPRAGIIHRLDKDTTGLLLVAKTLPCFTYLTRQMQAREIERRYLALVYGKVTAGAKIETYYGRHPRNRLKMAVCHQGREAITEFAINKRYDNFTLLDVRLGTGRTHQIRVHMAHIHHPIVGDPLYGAGVGSAPAEVRPALREFKRQALHACQLSFIHPQKQQQLSFTASLPADFEYLLKLIACYDEIDSI